MTSTSANKWLGLSSRTAFTLLILAAFLCPGIQAQYETENRAQTVSDAFVRSHQLGVRIGGWINRGQTPLDSMAITTNSYYQSDFGSGNIYLEGFFGYRFNPHLMMELSLGVLSRGDVVLVEEDGGQSIGNMMVYPILGKVKLYPFGGTVTRVHPYLFGGGGFYYGRHDVQFTSGFDAYLRDIYDTDSQTKFSYTFGAGLEWPVATMVGLELQVQYMDARFSDNIIGINDYSAVTVSVGVKHLFRNTSKD